MSECPSGDTLVQFAADTLVTGDRVVVERHLDACESCRQKSESLSDLASREAALFQTLNLSECHPDFDLALLDRVTRRGFHDEGPPQEIQLASVLRRARILGKGGLGEVHAFDDRQLHREMAVKFIREDFAGEGEQSPARLRFIREYEITSHLDHPGITPVFGIGETADHRPFYAMKLLDGRTLQQVVATFHASDQTSLSRNFAAFRVLLNQYRTICTTIEHAHCCGVWHRDLKTANIMISGKGDAIVVDWGLAKREHDAELVYDSTRNGDDVSITGMASKLGSPAYMSPEQAAGRIDEVKSHTDVYGLGTILFEILTGCPPHRLDESFTDLMPADRSAVLCDQIVKGKTPRTKQCHERRKRHVPGELDSICAKAMARTPQERYQSAYELENDIGCWLAGEKVSAHTYSQLEKFLRGMHQHIHSVLVALVVLLAAAISAGGVGVALSVAFNAEQDRRVAVEALNHEVATLLTKSDIDAVVKQLKLGDASSDERLLVDHNWTLSWDTRYLNHALSLRPRPQIRVAAGKWGVVAAVYDDVSRKVAVANADGELSVWDLVEKERTHHLAKPVFDQGQRINMHYGMRHSLKEDGKGIVEWFTGLAWLAGDKQLAAAAASGRALVFDVTTGESRELMVAEKPLLAVAATSDGKAALFGDSAGRVYLRTLDVERTRERVVVAAEPTAVTSILWQPTLASWIVGDAAGRVQVLDGATLETIASAEISGVVWSLATVTHNEVIRIAVGGQKDQVLVFRFEGDPKRLLLGESLALPQLDVTNQAAHALRFDPRGEKLWAIDGRGFLVEWDVSRRQIQWTVNAVRLDDRRRGLEDRLEAQQPPEELPVPFRRVGAAILATGDQGLVTAGDDGLLAFWSAPLQGDGLLWGTTVHERLVGPGARIAFSTTSNEQFWALDRDGELILADAATGKVLARRAKAHSGGSGDLAVMPDSVVTVGGDAELRFWRFANGKLETARPPIRHDHPLVSVAASGDGKWLAAVDERSGFSVWNAATGERQFFDQLADPSDRPHTGRTAFHPSGKWLAAFAAGQTGCVFVCREQSGRLIVRRLSDQINVAGMSGGTAMAWSPAWPDRLVQADDHPRLNIRSFGETAARKERAAFVTRPVVAIIATPDGRRLIAVEQDGRLLSLDARHELQMVELQSSLKNVSGLAIDKRGERLAIANEEGSVEIWHTGNPPVSSVPEPNVATSQWIATDLLHRDSAKIHIAEQTLQFDTHGRACFLAIEAHPGDFRDEGALYFIAEDGLGMTRERITVGNPELERRMAVNACGLQLHADQPVVVFRCRTAELSPYDGAFYSARRTKPGVWELEQIHAHGNFGFRPAMLMDIEGRLTDLFHFDSAGFYLRHSFRDEDSWRADVIAEQGDGRNLSASGDSHSKSLHMLFDVNRFNGDPVGGVYFRWQRDSVEMVREQLPSPMTYADHLTMLPNGQPVVLQHRHEIGQPDRLLTRTEKGWMEYQRLPPGLEIRSWEIGLDGATYFTTWQIQQERLVLWRGKGEDWSGQVVTTKLPAVPTWRVVRIDPQGRPVVVAGNLDEPFGWLRAYRTKQPSIPR